MTGLLLIFVFGIWFMISKWIASKVVRNIKSQKMKRLAMPLILVFLMLAPLADEVIGGVQFYALCSKEAVLKVDEDKAKDKTVKVELSVGKNKSSAPVVIREQTWSYIDIKNSEEVLSYKTLHAAGGWLIKTLGISETNAPLIFGGVCGPAEQKTIFNRLNMTVLYK